MEVWDKKSLVLSRKRMEQMNVRRLISFLHGKIELFLDEVADRNFEEESMYYEHIIIEDIIEMFEKLEYDFDLLETEIDYENKTINVHLEFKGITVDFVRDGDNG